MILRQIVKEIYFYKIKKWTVPEYRLYHLKRCGMTIGENCEIYSDNVETKESYLVTIGNNVVISDNVEFSTHDASAAHYLDNVLDIYGRITIGNMFIDMGSIILPGVTIADNCIIGAGSVVTKSFLKLGGVIAGNPARRICSVAELKEKNEKYRLDIRGKNRRECLLSNEDKFKVATVGD